MKVKEDKIGKIAKREYKLMRQKTGFVRGKTVSQSEAQEALIEESFALQRLRSSKMDNALEMIKQYSAKKAKSKDVRTDALGYMIRKRNVLND